MIEEIDEIRYLDNKQNSFASLNYSWLSSEIKLSYPKKYTKELIFTSKENPEKMIVFWNELIESALNKRLKDIGKVVNDLNKEFKIK